MVDSRLRLNPPSLFHCFVRVIAPLEGQASYVEKTFPEDFEEKEGILKGVPAFCFPCSIDHDGVQYSTFVLTDLDSNFRFGFCRYPPRADHGLCIVSYFPWFQTFYGVLDKVAQLNAKDNFHGVEQFLEALNEQKIPQAGSKLYFQFNNDHTTQSFKVGVPDNTKLPSIPEDRNLTEYFAKVTPENMVNLFISMLFERRIIVLSERLSVLTAVIHGAVSLLYPMQWQHIYIPILPPHLIDYCCAPMPFLLGVHATMMEKVQRMPLSEVVIFNADTNEMVMLEEDLVVFPSKISSKLKRKLKHVDRAYGDYVSRQFLNALADIMGGYRDALKFMETDQTEKIVFDDDMFVNSRTGSTRMFLESILSLQSFRQFIAGRLEKLNDDQALEDMFERTINQRSLDAASQTNYSHLKEKMRKGGGAIKKGGVALKKTVDVSYNHLREKAQDIDTKELKKKFKDKVKDVKDIMQISQKESYGDLKDKSLRKSWSPNLKHAQDHSSSPQAKPSSPSRHTMGNGAVRLRRPPPQRPPRPASELILQKHKVQAQQSLDSPSSNSSTSDIPTLLDLAADTDDNVSATLSFATSDSSDSSSEFSERCGGMANLAFIDPSPSTNVNIEIELSYDNSHRDSLINFKASSPTDEDLIFEQSPISPRSSPSGNSPQAMTSYQNPVLKKFENEQLFYKPKISLDDYSEQDPAKQSNVSRGPSLSRQHHVSGKKPVVPPRPNIGSPLKADKPQVPVRPATTPKHQELARESRDLIFEGDSPNDGLLASDTSSVESVNEASLTSPVTTLPSADLLGLEQSLFHETMKAMSDDTRCLLDDTRSLTIAGRPQSVNRTSNASHGIYSNMGSSSNNPSSNDNQVLYGNQGTYSNQSGYSNQGIHSNQGTYGNQTSHASHSTYGHLGIYGNQGNYFPRNQGHYINQGNFAYQGNFGGQGNNTYHGSNSGQQGAGLVPSQRTTNIRTFFEKGGVRPSTPVSSSSGRVVDSKVVNSTSSSDLFANCLEEAKNMKYIPR